LLADGVPIVPVVRHPAKCRRRVEWCWCCQAGGPVRAGRACGRHWRRHAYRLLRACKIAAAIIAAAPEAARLVLLGSTRKFTRWPDSHGNGVLRGEAALLASGRHGVMLHPTMIYWRTGREQCATAGQPDPAPAHPAVAGGGQFLVQPIQQPT